MKISGNTPFDPPASSTPATTTPKAAPEPAQSALTKASSAGVEVVISSGTRALGKEGSSQPADVDTKKVAAMKAAIADGSFTVNAEAIADKMLADTQDLLKA